MSFFLLKQEESIKRQSRFKLGLKICLRIALPQVSLCTHFLLFTLVWHSNANFENLKLYASYTELKNCLKFPQTHEIRKKHCIKSYENIAENQYIFPSSFFLFQFCIFEIYYIFFLQRVSDIVGETYFHSLIDHIKGLAYKWGCVV